MLFNARKALLTITTAAVMSVNSGLVQAADDELVVYSARNEHLIKPLFDAYTAKTGVEIKYVTDKAGPLLARLQAEGANTPADLLITVDAGNLWQAAEKGVLQSVESDVLEKNIPAHLRASDNQWVGLSVRARTLVYSTERVKPSDLSTYEALAEPEWKGRLCLRTSKKVYNQSLVATLIERHGEEKAEQIVKGWVANLATPVFSNDTKAMQAVAAGQCDVTIVNTYYFGRLEKKDPSIKLKLFFANQQTSGVHVNVSGAGVTKHAQNVKGAVKFLEWMSSSEAQNLIADGNMEYPANPNVKPAALVAAWGAFKQDQLNVESAGSRQADAIKLMDRADYR
ncbi:extracellular solute-binding protein [Aestuariirhabdus sp. LZHN29]|uniref:extracellular solute-binding protein n=1 Tax=Aestuariirhabdus sp. LZHN29 TaxID=3417462 RepID=UPI003CF3A765